MTNLLDAKAIRDRLSRIGKTTNDVARELGVSKQLVQGVISGRFKGQRGDAHKVAVALGMKDGIIVDDASSIVEAMRAVGQ